MNFAPIPNYIWAQIISYLPWDERIRIELVNKQFKKASKLSWRHQRKIDIDDRFNSSAKVWMLLKRCGSELEEISALRCLPQMPGHLGHICPKLKCLSFRSGATISFADRTAYWQQGFRTEIYRIFRSFGRLQRLEYFHPEKYCKYGDISLSTADVLCGLSCLPSLLELHIFGFESEEVWVSLPQLEHLEVLSIGVDTLPNSISRLSNLRELNIHLKIDGFIDDYDIKQLGKSLHSLETLVIVFGKGKVNLGLIPECIEAIPWLQTLVVVAPKVANLNTANVKSSRDGLHKLNVFINEEASHRITVVSANIHVIAIPNTKYGEAIDFLHGYKQNGFVFDNHSCLKMMLRSKQVRGDWDFFKVIEDTEKDEDEISSVAVDTLQGASNCLSAEAKLND